MYSNKNTNSVVSSGVVVCCIFFSSDQLLWVEELAVGSCADLVNYSGLQIHEDSPERTRMY